jgi:hypothetical protein
MSANPNDIPLKKLDWLLLPIIGFAGALSSFMKL